MAQKQPCSPYPCPNPMPMGSTDAGASIPGPTTKQMAEHERIYQEDMKRQKMAARRFIKKNPTTSI